MSEKLDHSLHRPRNRAQGDMSSDMQFSILLSRSLDVLGYNQNIIKHRVHFWKLSESIVNIKHTVEIEVIHAGSQTEGVVAHFGSDIDAMVVYNTVICADNILPFLDHRDITLFQTDSRDTEAGYTKLKLIEIGNAGSNIAESVFHSDYRTTYISSEFFTNKLMMKAKAKQLSKLSEARNAVFTKSGPAIPLHIPTNPDVVNDVVFCFKYNCPMLLQSWLRRPRRYNWPTRNIRYDISQMEAHVVPVGCKGSEIYYQEWRICFTKAEIHLVHSLNDTQIKMYIILKIIAKTILKTIHSEITSYVIKNIVFWMCESSPTEDFTEHQLLNKIFQALHFLRKCIVHNYLPSYMIPERNLFHCIFEPEQKLKLIDSLSMFIEEEHSALFHRLDKICDAMSFLYNEPQKAEFYRIKRNIVEKLSLLKTIRGQFICRDMSEEESDQILSQDEMYVNVKTALFNLVLPEWKELPSSNGIFMERLRHYNS